MGQLGYFEWLKSLRGKKIFEIFAWDDPKPFFHSIGYGMKLLRKVFKKAVNFCKDSLNVMRKNVVVPAFKKK